VNVKGQTVGAFTASYRLATASGTTAQQQDKIDLLYDSECPICMMEVKVHRRQHGLSHTKAGRAGKNGDK